MTKQKFFLATAIAALVSMHAWAQTSPAGLWKTIDDKSGKPQSLVRITESNGEFKGKVEKLFRPADQDQNPVCKKCEGANKDQPIIGMTILTSMKQDGDEYNGGLILDPNNGKVYKSTMSLIEGGKKLKLHGYIGVPMLGRTQVWLREE